MSNRPTVFIVDDDLAIRKSLRWLIESVGLDVRDYSAAQEFLDEYDPAVPGCIVLDVRMPGMSGLDLQKRLNEQKIGLPVIMVTGYGEVPMAVRAMKHGAVDFLEKPVSEQILLDHIQRAVAEDAKKRKDWAQHSTIREKIDKLTRREREVMNLVVDGLSSKEIAGELGISFKTVEAHRAKIMRKMEAKSVPNLIHMNLSLPDP